MTRVWCDGKHSVRVIDPRMQQLFVARDLVGIVDSPCMAGRHHTPADPTLRVELVRFVSDHHAGSAARTTVEIAALSRVRMMIWPSSIRWLTGRIAGRLVKDWPKVSRLPNLSMSHCWQ